MEMFGSWEDYIYKVMRFLHWKLCLVVLLRPDYGRHKIS